MANGQVTQHDLAQHLGISRRTVYRVLKGDGSVDDEKRKEILNAVKKYNYRPNAMARRLVQGSTLSIGLITWSTERTDRPGFPQILRGINSVTREHGYSLELSMIYAEENQHLEQIRTEVLREKTVDGYIIIFADEVDEADVEKVQSIGIPLVWMTRHKLHYRIPSIRIDLEQGYYQATCHLIEQGCKRIAFIAGILSFEADLDALAGYRRAIKEFGLPMNSDLIVEGLHQREASIKAAEKLLSLTPRPDGIVAANDISGIHALNVCREKGLRVPRDIAVIGFDDAPLAEEVAVPQLSSCRLPLVEMGAASAKLLIELCQGAETVQEQEPWLSKLIIRDSSRRLDN